MEPVKYKLKTKSYFYTIIMLTIILIVCVWVFYRSYRGEEVIGVYIVTTPTEAMVVSMIGIIFLSAFIVYGAYRMLIDNKIIMLTANTLKIRSLFLFKTNEIAYRDIEKVTFEQDELFVRIELRSREVIELHTTGADEEVEKAKEIVKDIQQRK